MTDKDFRKYFVGAFFGGTLATFAIGITTSVFEPAAERVSLEKRNPITLPENPNLTPGEMYQLKEHKFLNRTCFVAAMDSGASVGVSCYETKNESDSK